MRQNQTLSTACLHGPELIPKVSRKDLGQIPSGFGVQTLLVWRPSPWVSGPNPGHCHSWFWSRSFFIAHTCSVHPTAPSPDANVEGPVDQRPSESWRVVRSGAQTEHACPVCLSARLSHALCFLCVFLSIYLILSLLFSLPLLLHKCGPRAV